MLFINSSLVHVYKSETLGELARDNACSTLAVASAWEINVEYSVFRTLSL
jgi:hypothetical protein